MVAGYYGFHLEGSCQSVGQLNLSPDRWLSAELGATYPYTMTHLVLFHLATLHRCSGCEWHAHLANHDARRQCVGHFSYLKHCQYVMVTKAVP